MEEWLQLLQVVPTMNWPQWRSDRAQVLLTLLYCALLRISEAIHLTKDDIKEEEETWKIHIRQSKTDQFGTGATIYLARESWFDEILLRQINASPPGQLLCTANGTQWSEGAAATEIRRLCEKAGIRKLSPHAFRRGGTTRALEEGVPMELVQRRGRWASPRSMKPYIAHTATTQGGPADLIG
ncbi:hypothetical protein Y032_0420g1140 [Ancylostoma ceylanicum]|nr:hypothetical protein Y032_0420g1140 [Ancylostoma ceylanicum]